MSWLNLEEVKEQKFTAMSAGTYTVQVDKAETKNTKDNEGQYIEATFKVSEGDFKGRQLRHRFNIKNKSEMAQDIGLSQLKTFLLCSGHSGKNLEGVSELVGLKVQVVVHLKKDMKGEMRPEIKYFQTLTETPKTTGF